jgi:hypothetical protein
MPIADPLATPRGEPAEVVGEGHGPVLAVLLSSAKKADELILILYERQAKPRIRMRFGRNP